MSKTDFTLQDEALDAQEQNVTTCYPPCVICRVSDEALDAQGQNVTPCYPPCYVSDEALDAQGQMPAPCSTPCTVCYVSDVSDEIHAAR